MYQSTKKLSVLRYRSKLIYFIFKSKKKETIAFLFGGNTFEHEIIVNNVKFWMSWKCLNDTIECRECRRKSFNRIFYVKCGNLTYSLLYLTGEKIFRPTM